MKNYYSFSELMSTVYAYFVTKMFYPKARLIRRPFYIRGKKSLCYEEGFTTGHACRFDLPGNKKTLFIGKNCRMGDYVHIVAGDSVRIGNNCLLASKIFISDTSHGIYNGRDMESNPHIAPNDRPLSAKPVTIGDNVWIGENAVILFGVTVGSGCVIGANSVVTKDIPDHSIVAGAPARIIKKYSEDSKKWEGGHENV